MVGTVYGYAEWLKLQTLIGETHALELKLWLFEVCIGSHSLTMYVCQKNLWANRINSTHAGYVNDPLPNIHCAYCCLGACLHFMALLCIQLDCVVVFGPFFPA